MSEHQSHDPQQLPEAQPAAVAARGVSRTRRTLLRAGALGAPALIALKPAPVIACTCKLPSGFTVSGNASRGPKNCADPAYKPLTWKSSVTKVMVGVNKYEYRYTRGSVLTIHKGTKVSSLGFTTTGYGDANTTVDTWLSSDLSDTGLIMACYLDACLAGNDSTFPRKEKILAMWNQGVIGGSYLPANQTTAWTKAKVIAYLKFLTAQVV